MGRSFIFPFLTFILWHHLLKSQTNFEDVASGYGFTYAYDSNSVGGGVSVFDFNSDGLDDLSFATNEGDSLLFYLNTGCGFTKINGLVGITAQVKQISWVDIDNDGDKDLFLSTLFEGLRLYENTGNLQMTDITVSAGIGTYPMLAHGNNWADYDRDGDLDVYISTWKSMDTISNILYRNNGNNTFSNVTKQAGLFDTNSLSYASVFLDYNKDGWPDIYATTDKVIHQNKLYRNNGNGTFTDVSVSTGTNLFIESMCGTSDDYDNDGWPDIYITNTYSGNALLRNNGNGTFTDTAQGCGVVMNSWAWGASFLDGDNDGDLDLFVSAQDDGKMHLSSAYFRNNGSGQFTKPFVSGMAGDTARSYGNATGDINNDGLTDIAVANRDQPPNIWKNTSSGGNFLKVNLVGKYSSRDATGSFVYLYSGGKQQMRYTLLGESFLSQSSQYEIFGVGPASMVDSMIVQWPRGLVTKTFDVPTGTTVKIIESSNPSNALSLAVIGSLHPCEGDSLELRAIGSFNKYLWNTGDTLPDIRIDSSGTYSLTATASGGITRNISYSVVISKGKSFDFGPDTNICEGDEMSLSVSPGNGCVRWSDNSSDSMFVVNSAGLYHAEIYHDGCRQTDSINIGVLPVALVELGNDTLICAGDSLELDAGIGWASYYWSDNSVGRKLHVWQSGTYSVETTDSNNCKSEDFINVYVSVCSSIEEYETENSVFIFPNPANEKVFIKLRDKKEIIRQINISTIQSDLVLQKKFNNNNECEIDLSKINSGTYIISIETNNTILNKLLSVE